MNFADELCRRLIRVDTQLTTAGCHWLEAALKYVCRSVQGIADERMGMLTSELRNVKIIMNVSAVWSLLFSFSVLPPHQL